MAFAQPAKKPARLIFQEATVIIPSCKSTSSILALKSTPNVPLILNPDERTEEGLRAVIDYNMSYRLPIFAQMLNEHWLAVSNGVTAMLMFAEEPEKHPKVFGDCHSQIALVTKYGNRNAGKRILEAVDSEKPGYSRQFKAANQDKITEEAIERYLKIIEDGFLGRNLLDRGFVEKFISVKTEEDRVDLIRQPYKDFYQYFLDRKILEKIVSGSPPVDFEYWAAQRKNFADVFAQLPEERQIVISDLPCEHMMLSVDVLNDIYNSRSTGRLQAHTLAALARVSFSAFHLPYFKEEYLHLLDRFTGFSDAHEQQLLDIPETGLELIRASAIAQGGGRWSPEMYEASKQPTEILAAIEHLVEYLKALYKASRLSEEEATKKVDETLQADMPQPWTAYKGFVKAEKERAIIITDKEKGRDAAEDLARKIAPETPLMAILIQAEREKTAKAQR